MKKLVVLMIILGMTSLASADIVISVGGSTDVRDITIQPSDTITIGIYNAGGGLVDFLSYLDFENPQNQNYSLGNLRWGPAQGDGDPAPSFALYNFPTYDEVECSQTIAQGGDEKIGDMILIDLHCEGTGNVLLKLWDDRVGYDAPVDTLTVYQGEIPEPTTIALLGLGGFLVRRYRKKTA